MEKHRIQGLIQQADANQQQVQDSIAARPRGSVRDELISELIQSRLAVSRAQMNAEAGVSEQMIEEQQEIIAWLWRILEHTGMSQAQVRYFALDGQYVALSVVLKQLLNHNTTHLAEGAACPPTPVPWPSLRKRMVWWGTL